MEPELDRIDEVRIYNRSLSANEIMNMYANFTDIRNGLMGYWNLNESSGNIAHDLS